MLRNITSGNLEWNKIIVDSAQSVSYTDLGVC